MVDKVARDALTLQYLTNRVKSASTDSSPQHFMLSVEGTELALTINFVTPVECPEYFYKDVAPPEGFTPRTKDELILALPPQYLEYLDYSMVEKMIDVIVEHGCGPKAKFTMFNGNCWIVSARMIALLLVEKPDK